MIKNNLKKVHIHPILIVFILISFLTGTFVELSIILSIVLIHEFGHFMMASYFKWRIRRIMLWSFGGVMETDEHGNRPIWEEALVIIAGPFQHLVIYAAIFLISGMQLMPSSVVNLMFYYNTIILLFNLLPIWPLDGGKLLFLFLSSQFPFKSAYHFIILFSMFTSILLLILQLWLLPFTLSALFIMLFLYLENRMEWKHRYFVFMRFLLKRYEGNSSISGITSIVLPHNSSLMEVFSHFKRQKKHAIYVTYPNQKRKMIDETECLRNYFYYKYYNKTMGEIADYTS
ncbi:site-2 protease family protein [Virgibacillus oceani]